MSPDAVDVTPGSVQDMHRLQLLAIRNGVHQIRGLLLAGGYAKLMLQGRAGPLTILQREYLSTIVDNTCRIKRVLASLENVGDPTQLQLTRFPLHTLLEDLLRDIDRGATSALRQRWHLHAECKVFITADQKRLREAVLDLLQASEWSADVTIRVHEENECVVITLQGPFRWPNAAMAVDVHVLGGMSTSDSSYIQEKTSAECLDTVHLHGGSVSGRRLGSGKCEVKINLPVLSVSPTEDSSHG